MDYVDEAGRAISDSSQMSTSNILYSHY